VQDTTVIIQDRGIKQDTGHVGSGNMKINEFATQPENRLSFDVVDDAVVFMRNDPQFYRKKYFPAMSSMADLVRGGKDIDRNAIGSLVDTGMNTYCKKFNLGRGPADIFTTEDRDAIIEKICSEELEQINSGAY
jgi:hypothetical protein